MAYLIDVTYFKRELFVPNADDTDRQTYKELNEFIDGDVRQYLRDNLGYALFSDLDSQITDGNLNSDADAKWQNLVNGVEYTKDGKTLYWQGLLQVEGSFKRSLLANLVFVNWLENNQSIQSGVGEVVLQAKNAVRINSTKRIVKVWNDFVSMHQGEQSKYHVPHTYHYKGIPVIDWSENDDSNFVSLVRFLEDNESDYPDVPCKLYELRNSLGL